MTTTTPLLPSSRLRRCSPALSGWRSRFLADYSGLT